MTRVVAAVLIAVSLSACQSAMSLPAANNLSQRQATVRSTVAGDTTCLDVISRRANVLRRAGSIFSPYKIALGPRGHWRYGPQDKRVRGQIEFRTCDYNYFNVPVPDGYTAVWFGGLHLCDDACTFTFGTFDTTAVTYAVGTSKFPAASQYYLYAYTGNGKQLIESYPIEGLDRANRRLVFTSPLQNGFVWPFDDFVVFEIVAPS
jgi:hypothetical protein